MEIAKVPIMLDRQRTLFYPMPSLFELADAPFGENRINPTEEELRQFTERVSNESMKDKFTRIATRIWAGLIHEDRTLTIETVSWMIHAGNIEEATALSEKALTAMLSAAVRKGEDVAVPLEQAVSA